MRNFNNSYSNQDIDKVVNLKGWVSKVRDLGGLIFIDLRDRSGIIQVIIRPENEFYELASLLKSEDVVEVEGKIIERENKNEKIINGDIEIELMKLIILNKSIDLPFEINDNITTFEETRLKYRYLDLRRDSLKNNLINRHKIVNCIREYLNNYDFIEIETPILTASSPEGARDYLVPSRINKGNFYALPQSPQIFKQLLMVSGFERYYQIARCFRDEDLRADRQPEFSQVDIEMSFVNQEDVINLTEGLFQKLFKNILNIDIKLPLAKISYQEAIDVYGSDKPDLRFDLKINNITDIFTDSDFELFKNVIKENGIINCLISEVLLSRSEIDKLDEFVKNYQVNNLFWLKYQDGEFSGGLTNKLKKNELNNIKEKLNIEKNSLILIIAGDKKTVKHSLGAMRLKLGRELNLINDNQFNLAWLVDFPLFEYDLEEKRYYANHHPFTSPLDTDLNYLNEPEKCLAKAYDIIINGYEVGGGSIRINNSQLQEKMFEVLGLTKEEVANKFGFLIDAFKFGTPPHGGIALGLERIVMLFSKTTNIKDVIAFPKTASAACLMTSAPNQVSEEQLKELGIKISEL